MDILLNALANANRCKVILYSYRDQSTIKDTQKSESEKEFELFYFNEHYEIILPFSETVLPQSRQKLLLPQSRQKLLLPQSRQKLLLPQSRQKLLLPQSRQNEFIWIIVSITFL